MDQEEIDSILQVVENPVRRRIIRLLSQEPCYALQLSKELGLGQPLIAKHLGVMEDAGLVVSAVERSPSGPPRKRYALAKSVSITMDVAPNLFIERAVAFEPSPASRKESTETRLSRMIEQAVETSDNREKLSLLSKILYDVDKRIASVESERVGLLRIRDEAMREASHVASSLDGFDRRRVLHHILDEHDREVETISESLNLRELVVRTILDELQDYFD